MKKLLITILLYMMTTAIYSKDKESVNFRIDYIDFDIYTITPLSEKMLLSRSLSKELNISTEKLDKIKRLIINRTEITEINVITGFNFDFLDAKESNKVSSNKSHEKKDIQKRQVNDFDLNVRYVVKIYTNGEETKLLIGQNGPLIGMDGRFYEIPAGDYFELLKMLNSFIEYVPNTNLTEDILRW